MNSQVDLGTRESSEGEVVNDDEKFACLYLREKYPSSGIVYEPNGKDTFPDFSIDKNIAVEVRRLNINYSKEERHIQKEKNIQIETFTRGVDEYFRKKIDELNNKTKEYDCSYNVRLIMRKEPKQYKKRYIDDSEIKALFKEITPGNNKLNDLFNVRFSKTDKRGVYLIYSAVQTPAIGVLDTLYRNIQYCIDDKNKKINGKYNEYQLLLVNQIMRVYVDEMDELKNSDYDNKHFSKITVIQKNNETIEEFCLKLRTTPL